MPRSVAGFAPSPSSATVARAVKMGLAANILRAAPATYTFAYANRVLMPALQHEHLKFYFDAHGNEVGFVVWAMLAPGVEEQFHRDREWNLHISEWNEGNRLWILDLVAPHGHFKEMIRDLARSVFPDFEMVHYCRIRRGKLVQKAIYVGPSRKPQCVFRATIDDGNQDNPLPVRVS